MVQRIRKKPRTDEAEIPGFSYYVSTEGIVWNNRGWVIKLDTEARVTLSNKNKKRRARVAVLVLEAFVGPRPNGYIACHRDDNVFNNRLDNLYWGTHSDNVKDAIRNGTHKGNSSERSIETRKRMSQSHKGIPWSKARHDAANKKTVPK